MGSELLNHSYFFPEPAMTLNRSCDVLLRRPFVLYRFLLTIGGVAGACLPICAAPVTAPVAVLQVGPGAPVTSVSFSPDGKSLLTGSQDKTVTLWELPSGQIRSVLRGGTPSTVIFSPNGRLAAAGEADGVHLWDKVTGAPLSTLPGRA